MTDDLMRLFGSDRVMGMMDTLGIDEDTPIDQKLLSNAIESAQKKVESRNFSVRKTVLEYDDVMNQQREIIYGQRMKVLNGENLQESIASMVREVIEKSVNSAFAQKGHLEMPATLTRLSLPLNSCFYHKTTTTLFSVIWVVLLPRLFPIGFLILPWRYITSVRKILV